MDSRGGGYDSESGGYHRDQQPRRQSSGSDKNDPHYNDHHNASTFVSRGTMCFIAFATSCVVLYITFGSNQIYLPNIANQLPKQSQDSANSIHCSIPPDIVKFLASLSNSSSSMHAQPDELLQEKPSPVSAAKVEFLPGNSSAVSNNSPVRHAQDESSPSVSQETEEAKLGKMLSEAAMESKTVIVTTVNEAWAAPNSLLDLFLESFKIGIETEKFLKHLVVIALDQKAYSRCLVLHPHCFALTTEGVDFSGQAAFMAGNYVRLVWRKIEFMYTILQLGYNAIFTDADIVWFRDPFPHFHLDADLQISCDHYKGTLNGSKANTGFYYVKSNSRTIQFFKFWLSSGDKIPRDNDQGIFNKITSDPFINQTGIQIRYLNTAFYGGFCEPSKDLNLICIMHTNCCYGLDNKLHDLKELIEIWKNYMALPREGKESKPQNWTMYPRKCG